MIPLFLIKKFGPTGARLAYFGAITAALSLLLLLTYCQGRTDGKTGEVVKQVERENKVLGQIGQANEGAASSQAEDAVRSERQRKELDDALKATDNPDRQRALRGCVILRSQGRDTSRIAACSGPPGRP